VGTAAALWGVTAAVYLALMGPKGMQELGKHILQKSQYAMKRIASVKGVSIRYTASHFKEFVVDFSKTGKSVNEINKALLSKGIFGGKDLSSDFPQLGGCALYCVTEMVSKDDIDTLVNALNGII
jgi:glycine dehydrogenase subunit 1